MAAKYEGPSASGSYLVVRTKGGIFVISAEELDLFRRSEFEKLEAAALDEFFADHRVDAAFVSATMILNGDIISPPKKTKRADRRKR
jgi:hypothetical protein